MQLRFLFVRAAAGTLAVGSAAPVNLPYEMPATEIAATADAGTSVRPVAAHVAARRGDVALSDAGDLHRDAHLLKIGANGELPCDSGDWATSPLFGPHAALAEALGVKPAGTASGARDVALANALSDHPATGDAASSAFGSVFGNAERPSIGSPGGGLFTSGGTGAPGGGTGGAGPILVGGGTTTGGGTDPIITGPNTGADTGGSGSVGGPTGPTGGTGPAQGGGDAGGNGGGSTDTGSTGGPGTGPALGGSTGGPGTSPPLTIINPGDPGTPDHADSPTNGPDGGPADGSNVTQPIVPGAVPEPSNWLTMLVGFGLIGSVLRARRRPHFA